jgi:hypothetical protein|tara:strand:+ start:154 stop:429 length:276 start_codon:yes stop_codon:yes gene_type:complete
MILNIALIILGILVVILGYTTINLLRKNEKMLEIIINQNSYIAEFSKQLDISDKRLQDIDSKGVFKGDDEIGWIFDQIKVLQTSLSRFKIQ